MDDIVTFIDNLNTYSHPSILRSYKKLLDYLSYSSIKITLNDALEIISKSNNIGIIIKSIKEQHLDDTKDINENISNLFMAYDILDNNDTYCDNNKNDSLDLYLSSLPSLLTEDELNKEITKKMNGDKDSINTIVNHNLRLVVYLAKLYKREGISIMDLIQEGNIALIKATEKYNPSYNTKFTIFVSLYIRGYILDYIYNNLRMIKLPKSSCVMLDKINKLKIESIEEPTIYELSKYTSISIDKLEKLYDLPLECESLDALKNAEYLEVKNDMEEKIIRKTLLKEACELLFKNPKLNSRYKEILLLRYGLVDGRVWELDEIGKKYNLTKEGVRYIENRCLKMLSNDIKAYKLYIQAEDRENENMGIILKYGVSN